MHVNLKILNMGLHQLPAISFTQNLPMYIDVSKEIKFNDRVDLSMWWKWLVNGDWMVTFYEKWLFKFKVLHSHSISCRLNIWLHWTLRMKTVTLTEQFQLFSQINSYWPMCRGKTKTTASILTTVSFCVVGNICRSPHDFLLCRLSCRDFTF